MSGPVSLRFRLFVFIDYLVVSTTYDPTNPLFVLTSQSWFSGPLEDIGASSYVQSPKEVFPLLSRVVKQTIKTFSNNKLESNLYINNT